MKTPKQPKSAGFTLIELLVVISIIGILAGLLLPALAGAKAKAQKVKATAEIKNIVMAINQYQGDYHRYPAGRRARQYGVMDANPDFTFGTVHSRTTDNADFNSSVLLKGKAQMEPLVAIASPVNYKASNAEVMAILRDETSFADGSITWNVEHSLNPKRRAYLDAKVNSAPGKAQPGIGADGVYRDPWCNPYIISLDLNGDDRCRDAFYCQAAVSAVSPGSNRGLNGLSRPEGASGNTFELNSGIMVWSLGPDSMADASQSATAKPNRDNILSW